MLSFIQVEGFSDPAYFRKHIITPLSQDPNAIETLRSLVQTTTIRRTKESVAAQLNLPPRTDITETVILSEDEQKLYKVTRDYAQKYLLQQSSKNRKCFSGILQVILRLRQICNHGADLFPTYLRSKLKGMIEVLDGKVYLDLDEFTCEVCEQAITEDEAQQLPSRLACPHILCESCSGGQNKTPGKKKKSTTSKKSGNLANCPLCFPCDASDSVSAPGKQIEPRLQFSNYQPSSKVQALLKNIRSANDTSKKLTPSRPWNFIR